MPIDQPGVRIPGYLYDLLFPLLHRIKANLEYCAEMIPTLSTQLRIIASVKAATPDDASVSCAHGGGGEGGAVRGRETQ